MQDLCEFFDEVLYRAGSVFWVVCKTFTPALWTVVVMSPTVVFDFFFTALTMFLSSAAAVVVVLGPTCWMSVCSVRQYRLFLFQDIPKSLCNGSGKVFNTSRCEYQKNRKFRNSGLSYSSFDVEPKCHQWRRKQRNLQFLRGPCFDGIVVESLPGLRHSGKAQLLNCHQWPPDYVTGTPWNSNIYTHNHG